MLPELELSLADKAILEEGAEGHDPIKSSEALTRNNSQWAYCNMFDGKLVFKTPGPHGMCILCQLMSRCFEGCIAKHLQVDLAVDLHFLAAECPSTPADVLVRLCAMYQHSLRSIV